MSWTGSEPVFVFCGSIAIVQPITSSASLSRNTVVCSGKVGGVANWWVPGLLPDTPVHVPIHFQFADRKTEEDHDSGAFFSLRWRKNKAWNSGSFASLCYPGLKKHKLDRESWTGISHPLLTRSWAFPFLPCSFCFKLTGAEHPGNLAGTPPLLEQER